MHESEHLIGECLLVAKVIVPFSWKFQQFSTGILSEEIILRIREKITSLFIALRFRSYLVDLIELNRRRSLSYTEDSVNEARAKMA